MAEKFIKQNGRLYKEYDYITDDIRIHNLDWRWIDFIVKEGEDKGYIDWEKIDNLINLWVIMLTGYGTGKTFGVSKFLLMKKKSNIGLVSNTSNGADRAVEALLGAFKKDKLDYFDGWLKDGINVKDTSGNIRIKLAGMKNKGGIKQGRDMDAPYIEYDEFNQDYQYAQEKGTKPVATIDTIKNRFSDEDHGKPLNHIFMFGNKDGKKNFLALPIMTELGIYGFSEYTEIFEVERLVGTKNHKIWYKQSIVFNPRFNQEERDLKIENWLDHPEKFKSRLDSLANGTASVGVFNDDSSSWIFDNINLRLEEEHPEKINKKTTWYLYNNENQWFEMNLLPWGKEFEHRKMYVKLLEKEPDSKRKFCWGNPKQDGVQSLRQAKNEHIKDDLIRMVGNEEIIYDKIATKVNFLQDFGK